MAYIGNQADTAFTSLIKQDLTGASGTSLTLTHAVANANDIALYINNVRQEPVSAYSTNGTAVSLTGSVVSSDDIYVIYLARAVQTTVPPDGSVSTAKIASSAVSSAKIADGSVTTAKLQSGATFNPITNLQFFRLDGDVSTTTTLTTLTSYADGHDTDLFKRIGTAWSNSSGVFTPSASGLYEITFIADLHTTANSVYVEVTFQRSTDSGSNYTNEDMYSSALFSGSTYTNHHYNFIRYYNIADASTFRFKVGVSAQNTNVTFRGSGGINRKCALIFKRLADAQ